MKKYFVTGAAGFIGFHLCKRLLDFGHSVQGMDNMNDYYDFHLKNSRLEILLSYSNFIFYREDITSKGLKKIIDVDLVYHLAAQPGVRYSLSNPRSYLERNIDAFLELLEWLKSKNVPLIYASSSSVYGKSESPIQTEEDRTDTQESLYGATKKMNELMAHVYSRLYDVRSIGLRFFTVYGPYGRPDMAPAIFVDAAFKGAEIKIFNHGNQTRDFTYIDDIVESMVRLDEISENLVAPMILNIGKGKPDRLLDFVKNIEHSVQKKIKISFVAEMKGDVQHTNADANRLFELIKFKPKVDLEEGIDQYVKWYKNFYSL